MSNQINNQGGGCQVANNELSRDEFLNIARETTTQIIAAMVFIRHARHLNKFFLDGSTDLRFKSDKFGSAWLAVHSEARRRLQSRLDDATHPLGYPMVKDFEQCLEYFRKKIIDDPEIMDQLDQTSKLLVDTIANWLSELIELGKNY